MPSDYECPDGELAATLNLIPEDGGLHPIMPPLTMATLPQETEIVHVHKNVKLSNYIFKNEREQPEWPKGLYWLPTSFIEDSIPRDEQDLEEELFKMKGEKYVHLIVSDEDMQLGSITKIDNIGNTLVLLTTKGTFFFLWKAGTYVNLGEKPSPISARYYVQGPKTALAFDEDNFWGTSNSDKLSNVPNGVFEPAAGQEMQNRNVLMGVSDYIFSAINRVREYTRRNRRFQYPFFIRLAYRTITGAHIMHTAPFLVVPNTTGIPFVFIGRKDGGKFAFALNPSVHVGVNVSGVPDEWKDIIESVDIFITPEIQAYSEDPVAIQAPEIMECFEESNVVSVNGAKYEINDIVSGWENVDYTSGIHDLNASQLHTMAFNAIHQFGISKYAYVPLQRADGKTLSDLVKEEHRFYLYKSLPAAFFTTGREYVEIELEQGEYAGLSAREQMDDDYRSRDGLIASSSYVYNSRLNLALEKREIGKPDYIAHFLPTPLSAAAAVGYHYIRQMAVEVEENGGSYVTEVSGIGAQIGDYNDHLMRENLYYFFYPNMNARALYIQLEAIGGGFTYEKIALQHHPSLNGAYAFNNFKAFPLNDREQGIPDANIEVPYEGMLYTSDVNMPFIFSAKNVTQVGTGSILALSSATKALSPGQFGQFPMYAFSTDGVWALDVNTSDGTFYAPKPVTRDVMLGKESFVQTDNAVVFSAQRGIMLLQGSDAVCISEVLDAVKPFDISSLLTQSQKASLLTPAEISQLDYIPFRDYLANSRFLFDYTHQRVIVYNEDVQYAYVFSMRSKQWGITASRIKQSLRTYPYAQAVTHSDLLVDYARSGNSGARGTVLVTRPLKLGGADILKTIDAVIQRGYFVRGDVKSVLFGSRDLMNWVPVWSSVDHELCGFRGTPYKYFRVMLLSNLTEDKSIFGMSINFDMRDTNRLR